MTEGVRHNLHLLFRRTTQGPETVLDVSQTLKYSFERRQSTYDYLLHSEDPVSTFCHNIVIIVDHIVVKIRSIIRSKN